MMQFSSRFLFGTACVLAAVVPALASPHLRRGPTAPRISRTHAAHAAGHASTVRGIDPDRATQIQTALIKAGYLTGTPTGTWDAPSQAAMEKMQADNGWQTKLVPDSRAIIKLGLGPKSTADTSEAATSAPDASFHVATQ